jgi:hypothetical protein
MKPRLASEKTLEKKVVAAVKIAGGIALKVWSVSFSGLPDRQILLPNGRIIWAEIKSEGKFLSPRQRIVIPMLMRLGFEVWVIDDELSYLAFTKSLYNE